MGYNFRVTGVSGSLRKASVNHLFLRSMRLMVPDNINFKIFHGLGSIPLFNPDLDEQPSDSVIEWRDEIAKADMLLLVSPEYARGVTGVIKNAMDWIVGSGELMGTLIAFPNLSVRTSHAQSQLTETLNILGGRLITECSPKATEEHPLVLQGMDEYTLTKDRRTRPQLKKLWKSIVKTLEAERTGDVMSEHNKSYLW